MGGEDSGGWVEKIVVGGWGDSGGWVEEIEVGGWRR